MLTNPLISIIIPCYNVSSYVKRAIESILNQTYKNLEIWIIDDASTDDTLLKIEAIKDSRIKIASYKDNTQKVGAVNEVLTKVTGEYIAFQDADDWSEPVRIQDQLHYFQNDEKLGICFTNYRYIGARSYIPDKISLTNDELKNEFLNYTYKRESGLSATNCPTMMISRAALNETKGYSPFFAGRVAEDIQWIYRILKSFKGITIDKILYNYCIRQDSFTGLQSKGIKPKYAYSWQLLSKIIYKDVHEGVDVLLPENLELLKKMELEACETALAEKISELNKMINVYESSLSFKIGKFILSPWRLLKSFRKTNFF